MKAALRWIGRNVVALAALAALADCAVTLRGIRADAQTQSETASGTAETTASDIAQIKADVADIKTASEATRDSVADIASAQP